MSGEGETLMQIVVPAVDHAHGVDEGLDVFDGVAVVERKGRDQADPSPRPPEPGDQSEDLSAQEMSADALFGALAVSDDHAAGPADRLLGDTEETGLELGGDIGLIFRRDDGDKLNRHGGRILLQGFHEFGKLRRFLEVVLHPLDHIRNGDELPLLHDPAQERPPAGPSDPGGSTLRRGRKTVGYPPSPVSIWVPRARVARTRARQVPGPMEPTDMPAPMNGAFRAAIPVRAGGLCPRHPACPRRVCQDSAGSERG